MNVREYAAAVAANIVETDEKWIVGTHSGLQYAFLVEVSHILRDFNIEYDVLTNSFRKISAYNRQEGVEL